MHYGILSIDYVHQKIYFQPFDLVPIPESEAKVTEVKAEDGKMNPITRQFFLEHIFDYRTGNDFVYNGDKPVVVDFWATWCGPCLMQAPILEQLSEEIDEDELKIVKIDVDENPDTAQKFGIMSIPTLLFKKDGEVVKQVAGVHTKEQIKEIVAELS